MTLAISVIICTHNPQQQYLNKVLAALKSQTLLLTQWELLLIDNASDRLLADEIDLNWHPYAHHIREDQLGLTPARLRGIREAQAETIVFVDDDNVLDSDYLEITQRISQNFPCLGAWGGQIQGGFESPPPDWTKPYWCLLAIREFERDKWSNLLHQYETTPCGAGLCVRKIVADKYTELVKNDPRRLALDRKGKLLMSCGDSDLAFTACDLNLGIGLFTALKLTHLMPPNRLEETYLLKLVEGITYSSIILHALRGEYLTLPPTSWSGKLYGYYQYWRMCPRERRFYQVIERAKKLAIQEISAS
jgi:glycosyltransferase involved in cell wall biosynthesis